MPLVRVRVWFRVSVKVRFGGIFLRGNCPRADKKSTFFFSYKIFTVFTLVNKSETPVVYIRPVIDTPYCKSS